MPNAFDLLFDRYSEVIIRERGLPHWRQQGKLYFVTWRQADSIPAVKQQQIKREREAFIDRYGEPATTLYPAEIRRRYLELFHVRVHKLLDAGSGSCVLRELAPRCIVRDTLKFFEGSRYTLGSFAIAGNHVHVLVAPVKEIDLSEVMHSWKSFTAKEINKVLGRTGMLWKAESYDHLVQSPESLARIEAYIYTHEAQGAYVERRRVL